MFPPFQPLQLLLVTFAGWVNRSQLDVIEYLQEENRVLKERLGGRRIRFTDAERRRLGRKAQALGRKVLNELETLVTPDTLLRWYRELVASKWNYSHRRGPGRPRVMQTIVDLVLQMALENPSWGYTRIQGAMANLGHEVGRGTIANILREYGIDPAPERDKRMPWSTFLRAHRECLVATDFLTVEVCTIRGLVTHYVLFFMDIANRAVKIAGITPHPDADTQRRDAQGLVTVFDHIRKTHSQGPAHGDPLAKCSKVQSDDGDLDAATMAIRKIHNAGARAEDPDFILKAASTTMRYRDDRPSVQAIRRAQSNPLTMQKLYSSGNGNHPIDMDAVQRIIAQGKRELRKTAGIPGAEWNAMSWAQRMRAIGKGPTVPPQSSNAQWSRQLADTGASGTINRDQLTPSQPFAGGHEGAFTDSSIRPNDARIRAAIASTSGGDKATQVDAIQADWKRAKERMAANFANRPLGGSST